MYHRFVDCLVVAIALVCVSPLWAEDDPPTEPAQPAVEAAADSPEAEADESAPKTHGDESKDSEGKSIGEHPVPRDDHAVHDSGKAGSGHAGDDHGGHGVDHDLSHANASVNMQSPQEFRSDLAIWTLAVFICLLVILGKFAWGPIMEGLEKREQSIAAMIDDAKQGQERAAEQLKEYEAKLAAAGEEARDLVAQARKDAESAKDRILGEAQEAADRQRQRAVEDIEVAKNVALQEITEKSVDLAVNLAGRIVRQQLNAEDHSQLIREAMDQLPSRN